MAGRPGTMIYFDLLDDLEDFTDEEAGQLFRAILWYGSTGEVPAFMDRSMRSLWRKAQGMVDRSGVSYDNTVLQRQYAVYCREERRAGREPLSYDDWRNGPLSTDNEIQRPLSTDIKQEQELGTVTVTLSGAGAGTEARGRGGKRENQATDASPAGVRHYRFPGLEEAMK